MAVTGGGLVLLCFAISITGASHSSPPSPITSGAPSANLTTNPFLFGLLVGVCDRDLTARSCCERLSAPACTWRALGYRVTLLVSSFVSIGGAAWETVSLSEGPWRKSLRFP